MLAAHDGRTHVVAHTCTDPHPYHHPALALAHEVLRPRLDPRLLPRSRECCGRHGVRARRAAHRLAAPSAALALQYALSSSPSLDESTHLRLELQASSKMTTHRTFPSRAPTKPRSSRSKIPCTTTFPPPRTQQLGNGATPAQRVTGTFVSGLHISSSTPASRTSYTARASSRLRCRTPRRCLRRPGRRGENGSM